MTRAAFPSDETGRSGDRGWLTQYLQLQKRYDARIDKLLRDARDAAEREIQALEDGGIGNVVRQQQLMQAVTAITGALGYMWMSLGEIVKSGQEAARLEAMRLGFATDEPLLRLQLPRSTVDTMRRGFITGADFNVEAALARVYKTRLPLSQQVYKTAELASGWVESRVNAALARGRNVTELAAEVRAFVDPRTPGGASYAARRLARTEINAAYHAVTIVHSEARPWVSGMRWNLSRSHPEVDDCDRYARNNGGIFPRDKVPRKPHPLCLCYVTPVVVSDEEFIRRYQSGEFREHVVQLY